MVAFETCATDFSREYEKWIRSLVLPLGFRKQLHHCIKSTGLVVIYYAYAKIGLRSDFLLTVIHVLKLWQYSQFCLEKECKM